MKALVVEPGKPETAGVADLPEPDAEEGSILVRALRVGICGTDAEIVNEGYGTPPPGEERLVIGHESLGEVLEAPSGSGFAPGDLVVGVVRRPDPVPCEACAIDAWDMCRNGGFVESGISGRQGYGRERYRLDKRFAVPVSPQLGHRGVLLEPTSVVAKAWEHADLIFRRAGLAPQVALVIGAGPIGLLAAMIARQRGLETHVADVVDKGPKPQLVADLGATYHAGPLDELTGKTDVVIECTGFGEQVLWGALTLQPGGVVALAGLSQSQTPVELQLDALNARAVLNNKALFGSVNASRRHYDHAAEALAQADRGWLERLISRQVPPGDWPSALDKRPDDIKVVVDMTAT